ncbi:MAG TPA: FtsK/SpoIIIE domain-containing protein [Acidimicrobiales bacterium]|nr:FtsK/SpoIIIE domain-containing protein [Acidimicrobiales bacterium]
MAPGWLRRRAGRDQPETNGDHDWTPGSGGANWDHDDDGPEDQTVRLVGDRPTRTVVPPRPYVAEDHWTERDRRPLVPEALREPADAIRFAANHAYHVSAFHVIRLPKYVGLNLLWSPRGLGRLAVSVGRWARVRESRDVEWSAAEHAITTRDYGPYMRVARERRDQVRSRVPVAVLGTAAAVALVVVGLTRWETVAPTVLTVVFGLGWWGRPMDRPYIESAVTSSPQARKITPDMIVMALYGAKLCKEVTGPDAPDFAAPGVYREKAGYGAIVDLPLGFTAKLAIKRKTDIAAGLRISERRLFIEQATGPQGHAGQVKLWIADDDPLSGPAVTSPLVKAAKFDVWQEVPFGQDEKDQLVEFLMLWTNVLIGALPRMGKTFVLRLLIAAAAMDPYVKLLLWDGKGGKDHAPFERVCHAFGAGASDEVAKALLATATDLVRDMDERYKKMSRLPDDRCPEGKLTRALARDRKLKMPVTFLAIDEFQVYLQNKAYGTKILEALTILAQRGSGAGIILALATQRPSSKIMNTDFRDLFGTRIALRMITDEASEMILGSGSSRAGLNTSKFRATDKGVCILLGADDGALVDKGGQTVHAHLMDLPAATKVANRARALREGEGTLTGVAAGEEDEALSDQVLNHVAAAFEGEDKAHSAVLCARLTGTYPGLYETWDQSDLAAALGRFGIDAGNQTWATPVEGGAKCNRKGFELKQVLDVLVEKAGEVPDSPPETTD